MSFVIIDDGDDYEHSNCVCLWFFWYDYVNVYRDKETFSFLKLRQIMWLEPLVPLTQLIFIFRLKNDENWCQVFRKIKNAFHYDWEGPQFYLMILNSNKNKPHNAPFTFAFYTGMGIGEVLVNQQLPEQYSYLIQWFHTKPTKESHPKELQFRNV